VETPLGGGNGPVGPAYEPWVGEACRSREKCVSIHELQNGFKDEAFPLCGTAGPSW